MSQSSNSNQKKIQDIYEQLSLEAEQEEAVHENRESFLADADPAKLANREDEILAVEKQHVRKELWLKTAKDLAEKKTAEKGKSLRYFTMPGMYRIDVQMLLEAGCIEVTEKDPSGAPLSIDAVAVEFDPSKFGLLDTTTPKFKICCHSKVEDVLTNQKNKYYDDLRAMFPFDIINLDLTTSLTPRHEGPFSDTLKSVEAVLKRQVDYSSRWALFLTYRNMPDEWESLASKTVVDGLQENLNRYLKVKDAFSNVYQKPDAGSLLQDDPKKCLSQAVVKWVLDRAHDAGHRLVRLKSAYYDKTPPGLSPYTIAKHVIVFEKGPIAAHTLPTKGTAVQGWMEDDIVKCIEMHKPVDVKEYLSTLPDDKKKYLKLLEKEIAQYRVC